MLPSRLELHAPLCAGASACSCAPVRDVEAFVRAAVLSHLGVGAKRENALTGPIDLTPADAEDLVADMIATAWEASNDFDGRGRFTGYIVWIIHRRSTDWLRKRFGDSRHKRPRPQLVAFDERIHDQTSIDDYPSDSDDRRELDLGPLSPTARDQLALLELCVEHDQALRHVAGELGVSPSLHALRREAVLRT